MIEALLSSVVKLIEKLFGVIFNKWNERLTEKEKEIVREAQNDNGNIIRASILQKAIDVINVGDIRLGTQTDNQELQEYVEALESLVTKGFVVYRSTDKRTSLYNLTSKGFKAKV